MFPTRFHGYCSPPPLPTYYYRSYRRLTPRFSLLQRISRGTNSIRAQNHPHSFTNGVRQRLAPGDGVAFNLAREKSPWFSARPSATDPFSFLRRMFRTPNVLSRLANSCPLLVSRMIRYPVRLSDFAMN